MTATQWTFELVGLVEKDKRRYDDIHAIVKTSRQALIDMLGLNLMPIEEAYTDETGEIFSKLKMPEEDQIMPLSFICGGEGYITELKKKHDQLKEQEEIDAKIEDGDLVEMSSDELEEFMQEDDIIFPDDPIELEKKLKWNSEDNKNILAAMVKPLEQKDELLDQPNIIEGNRRKASRLTIK